MMERTAWVESPAARVAALRAEPMVVMMETTRARRAAAQEGSGAVCQVVGVCLSRQDLEQKCPGRPFQDGAGHPAAQRAPSGLTERARQEREQWKPGSLLKVGRPHPDTHSGDAGGAGGAGGSMMGSQRVWSYRRSKPRTRSMDAESLSHRRSWSQCSWAESGSSVGSVSRTQGRGSGSLGVSRGVMAVTSSGLELRVRSRPRMRAASVAEAAWWRASRCQRCQSGTGGRARVSAVAVGSTDVSSSIRKWAPM